MSENAPGDRDPPAEGISATLESIRRQVEEGAGKVEPPPRSHEILRDGDEEAGRYPSDHYPVLAELELAG